MDVNKVQLISNALSTNLIILQKLQGLLIKYSHEGASLQDRKVRMALRALKIKHSHQYTILNNLINSYENR